TSFFPYLHLLSLITYLITSFSFFFFFNDTPPTEIYTLSLHDALPISLGGTIWILALLTWPIALLATLSAWQRLQSAHWESEPALDRKSTRLNSSHVAISYAVFCLKKKKKKKK